MILGTVYTNWKSSSDISVSQFFQYILGIVLFFYTTITFWIKVESAYLPWRLYMYSWIPSIDILSAVFK
ncbi:hypothetical protein A7K93_11200 [Candidatus Methylacidiphilum fumarolicum]|nr:hypothetical protein A7K73_11050 [Candidatus Methylacidiphilum fumarolicum]TFE71194.1 hypothetical protein A7K93_11200 [Candidatus Methylacidiphilum fumarolicum]TFE71645.1 hypothetical protein A7K72_10435 [Candidatus Methylacidiphilum fumarolicum]TFE76879.1 hypothetical protein A7D33_07720 [Candidatus Methylacidiphilum fumarolicum]